MAEWRIACDGEMLAWQRRGWNAGAAGEQRLAAPDQAGLLMALQRVLTDQAHAGDTLRLALGSHHIRVAALAWPLGRLSAAEQQALLYQRWQERLDDANHCWLGVEDSGSVRLATAVRHDLLQALEDTVSACAVRVRACLPAAGLALRHADATEAHIALSEGTRETIIRIADGHLAGLSSGWRTVPGTDMASAIPLAAGHAMRLDGGPRSWLEWF